VTSGVTAHRATRPERFTAFNPLTSLRSGGPEGIPNLRPFAPFTGAFGPTLVQGERRLKAVRVTPAPLLSVREVAAPLGVSRSTVYALCAEGKLENVRISNALRLSEEEIESFLRSARNING
jgi:excisionase family DNA binding protein